MQISWIKDLATLRNPRSQFTFLNYLHTKSRLVAFSDLSTFLPKRREYEDYMRWCAEAFDDVVLYDQEACEIAPQRSSLTSAPIETFAVRTRNTRTGHHEVRHTRHVVIAGGGKPSIPPHFPQHDPHVIHSSKYMSQIGNVLPESSKAYRIAVLGAGQSAAEVFNDLHTRFPSSRTRLIIRGAALKPSDDSPFVNEIFDPNRTDSIFNAPPEVRAKDIERDRDTNYSVVRLTLLEKMYENLYEQHLDHDHKEDWPHQILNHREVTSVETGSEFDAPVRLHISNSNPCHAGAGPAKREELDVDVVVVATGYERNLHDRLLTKVQDLKPHKDASKLATEWQVSRDYRVKFRDGAVSDDAGVWLQGCCEQTHGLSDTLLSILAVRSGELVESMLGDQARECSSRCTSAESWLKPASNGIMANGTQSHTPNGYANGGVDEQR
ncbi:MAG: hypothetical protein Q9159_001478 [Coniocarpon cinnabarinum]